MFFNAFFTNDIPKHSYMTTRLDYLVIKMTSKRRIRSLKCKQKQLTPLKYEKIYSHIKIWLPYCLSKILYRGICINSSSFNFTVICVCVKKVFEEIFHLYFFVSTKILKSITQINCFKTEKQSEWHTNVIIKTKKLLHD